MPEVHQDVVEQVAGVEIGALEDWLRSAPGRVGDGAIRSVRKLAGGTQNLSVQIDRESGTQLVLRRAVPNKGPDGDVTILREAQVLTALAQTDVPCPQILAVCSDPTVIGGAFYLMQRVDGYNPALGLREPVSSDPAMQRAMALGLVDAATKLGAVDPAAVGLSGLGNGVGWVERQVDRWLRYAHSYSAFDNYSVEMERATKALHVLEDWLNEQTPKNPNVGLVHGDLQFANVIVAPADGSIAAVVDWELCTVGDPLLDLGHVLETWPVRPALGGRLFGLPGLPTKIEVVERYRAQSSIDLDDLLWYRVLACFRLSIILEATYARSRAGKAPAAVGQRLHDYSEALLDQGASLIHAMG